MGAEGLKQDAAGRQEKPDETARHRHAFVSSINRIQRHQRWTMYRGGGRDSGSVQCAWNDRAAHAYNGLWEVLRLQLPCRF